MPEVHGSPPSLTFPAPLFRHIAPELYLHRHLQHDPPVRPSGRAPEQHRPFAITTSSLSHAHGSAVIRTGDTAVVCGVRGEILTLAPGDDTNGFERYGNNLSGMAAVGASGSGGIGGAGWGGLIVPNIELSTGCSKRYPLGAPGDYAQALAQRLNDLMQVTKVVDLKSLRIYSSRGPLPTDNADDSNASQNRQTIKGYWVLYIDVLCISLDGNILDAAWLAIMSALRSTKLPLAFYDADDERIICSSKPDDHQSLTLRQSVPVIATFAIISIPQTRSTDREEEDEKLVVQQPKLFYLNDPDEFEEAESKNFVSIVVSTRATSDGLNDVAMTGHGEEIYIERVEKYNGGNIGLDGMKQCVEMASARAKDFLNALGSS